MAKKKMGGLGKGLDLLFADLPETSSDDAAAPTPPRMRRLPLPCRCGRSNQTPRSPASSSTTMR